MTTAAVLYVFRTLVDADIPLNAGCLEPIDIVIPPGSMLSPVRAGRRGGRQRGDVAGGDGRAARRAGRGRGEPGDDEQPHLRRRPLPVLRDALRRRRGRTGLGRLQRRAHAHDQLAPHRPGGAGVALPGARGGVPRAHGQRRRRRAPRRRRRGPPPAVPGAAHGGDRLEQPPGAALRARRRPPRRLRPQRRRARGRGGRGAARRGADAHGAGRRAGDRDAGRRRLRRAARLSLECRGRRLSTPRPCA